MVSKIHGPKKEKKKRYGFSVNKINLRVALHRNAPTRSIKLETSPHSESCISCVDIGSNQMGYLLGSLFSLLPSVPERRTGELGDASALPECRWILMLPHTPTLIASVMLWILVPLFSLFFCFVAQLLRCYQTLTGLRLFLNCIWQEYINQRSVAAKADPRVWQFPWRGFGEGRERERERENRAAAIHSGWIMKGLESECTLLVIWNNSLGGTAC